MTFIDRLVLKIVLLTYSRVGVPSAAVYYSYEQGLWSPGAGSPDAEKQLVKQRKLIDDVRNQVSTTISPYTKQVTDQIKLPTINIPNINCAIAIYNSGVKKTVRAIADYDPKTTVNALVDAINQPPSSANASETKPKESA